MFSEINVLRERWPTANNVNGSTQNHQLQN